ncbi:Putative chromosome segregation in meiosis protein [Septoria linicola]|uniref:Chromosome segregation in meiosis protein n=1 Tax=Septoria linicola TaxID=215465 RepID=A0A9Q9ENI7_9PEZI|nr:Putative chromosome segregation in meiosis protein [Septoria linicola]
MPSAVSPNPRAEPARRDELDRLLDDDNAIEEFFQDLPQDNGTSDAAQQQQARDEDQEVHVKKKRVPIPKLDENRLLSDAGIPKLRKITKSKLKTRGKGHEFTDISNLLNIYQLWLDDLYPRAKFRDAVKMVEKVGHSKRMQVTRRAWLDDTKPNRRELTPPPDVEMSNAAGAGEVRGSDNLSTSPNAGDGAHTRDDHGAPEDDELEMLLGNDSNGAGSRVPAQPRMSGPFLDDEPDEDELDALLAVSGAPQPHERQKPSMPFEEEPEEDELDALMAAQTSQPQKGASATASVQHDRSGDFADDEEAMRDMW